MRKHTGRRVLPGLVFACLALILVFGLVSRSCKRPDQIPVEMVDRVGQMASESEDPAAVRAAAVALFAAGSEEMARDLLREVEEGRSLVLLRMARYTALRGRGDESVEMVAEAIGGSSGEGPEGGESGREALVAEAAQVAVESRSREILDHLLELVRTEDLEPATVADVVVAAAEIAVDSEDRELLREVAELEPALTETEAGDSALLALAWAYSHLATSRWETALFQEGLAVGEAISNRPRRVMAFAFLAQAAWDSGQKERVLQMGERMDETMADAGLIDLVEGHCRIALAFHPGGQVSRNLLMQALEMAEHAASFGGVDLPPEGKEQVIGGFSWLTARYFCWIARVAVEVEEPGVARLAILQASRRIADTDPEMSILLGATLKPFVETVEHIDDEEVQRSFLVAARDFANRMPDPFSRSMALQAISDCAQKIAVAEHSSEMYDLAWQSVMMMPVEDWRNDRLPELSYASARIGNPYHVSERLPGLLRDPDRALELRVRAAAMRGLADRDPRLTPRESRFATEAHVTEEL